MKNIRGYIEHIRESKSADRLGKRLIEAVEDNDIVWCKELIDAGANVNITDDYNKTPLLIAVIKEYTDIVKLLIDAGAEVDASTDNGWSSLHFATHVGQTDIVKLLIDAGAEVNLKYHLTDYDEDEEEEQTLLDVAIENGHQDIIKLLVLGGVDLKAEFETFKEFNDSFGGDIKWIPRDLIPPEWRESTKFTGTFGGFY